MMRILVADGNSRASLAIVRSLGAAGHDVFVGGTGKRTLAGSSKYCRGTYTYADPVSDRSNYVSEIVDLVATEGIDIFLPVTDVSLIPIAESRDKLPRGCSLPVAPARAIADAANKALIFSLARRLGVAIPETVCVDSKRSELPTGLTYPVVLKPSRSRVESGSGWLSTGVDYASTPSELQEKLEALPVAAFPVLLQDRIPGPGIGVFYCFDRGKKVATFAHRRLHEKPPSGGVSVLRESIRPNPQAEKFGEILLESLDWHGVAMVEFKLDERDSTPKLMEINGRFWGSLQLAIDSGVDFPNLLVRIAQGEAFEPVEDYKLGVRSRWLLGELDLFLLYLTKSSRQLNLPDGHKSRLMGALKAVSPFVRNQRLEVLRLRDLRPWFFECRNWFRN